VLDHIDSNQDERLDKFGVDLRSTNANLLVNFY